MRKLADDFLYEELCMPIGDSSLSPIQGEKTANEKLRNLLHAMGKTFFDILLSDRAERMVFSIALSNIPDEEIREVLNLGVRLNYLHQATIGDNQ